MHVRTANLWGLPVNFIAFSVVSVVVTAGTFQVYGEHVHDPVEIVARIDSIWAPLLGAVTFAVATLGINVVANFVSPAYDLANAWPSQIDFKRGGLISAMIALVITPWNLFNSPVVINLFLGAEVRGVQTTPVRMSDGGGPLPAGGARRRRRRSCLGCLRATHAGPRPAGLMPLPSVLQTLQSRHRIFLRPYSR